jgi:hypothetical protein
VRDDAANFFALLVLLAEIHEATGGSARLVFELKIWERRGEQALTRERERHAAGIDGNPAASPLFGDIGGRAAPAGRINDKIARVGGH